MERKQMTKEQKEMLLPYAEMYAAILVRVEAASDDELVAIIDAAQATSVVNCWFATYQVAEIIAPHASEEQSRRKRALTPGVQP